MDTSEAHYIYQLDSALKLIGVDVIVTGIRPEISQTLVSLGYSI
ncbi:hypothetical protein [Radiobacillus sp. PE A8.2]